MKTVGLFSDRTSAKTRELNYKEFELIDNEVVTVKYSSINYKDRLLVSGAAHVSRHKSIVPGIDVVGSLKDENFVSAGFDLGVNRDGGWAKHCEIPESQLTIIPDGFSLEACAAYGTAGLTAAEIVRQIIERDNVVPLNSILIVGGVKGASFLTVIFLLALNYRVTLVSRDEQKSLLGINGFTNISLEEFFATQPLSILRREGEHDAVINFLGGGSLLNSIGLLGNGGILFSVGNILGNSVDRFSLAPFFLRGICLQGINLEILDDTLKASLWQFIFKNEHLWREWMSWSVVRFTDLKDYLLEAASKEDRPRVIVSMGE